MSNESNLNQLRRELESKIVSLESKLKAAEAARARAEDEIERKKNEIAAERQKAFELERNLKEEEVSL